MIIVTNTKSLWNFQILVNNIIGGLKFSMGASSRGNTLISLDEVLDTMHTSSGTSVTAAGIVNTIGANALKSLVENIANGNSNYLELRRDMTLDYALMSGFEWAKSPQGNSFWNAIHSDLVRIKKDN